MATTNTTVSSPVTTAPANVWQAFRAAIVAAKAERSALLAAARADGSIEHTDTVDLPHYHDIPVWEEIIEWEGMGRGAAAQRAYQRAAVEKDWEWGRGYTGDCSLAWWQAANILSGESRWSSLPK
jgi:hypothetical protein